MVEQPLEVVQDRRRRIEELEAENKRLRRAIEEIANDNSPHDAQLTACFVAEAWRG